MHKYLNVFHYILKTKVLHQFFSNCFFLNISIHNFVIINQSKTVYRSIWSVLFDVIFLLLCKEKVQVMIEIMMNIYYLELWVNVDF